VGKTLSRGIIFERRILWGKLAPLFLAAVLLMISGCDGIGEDPGEKTGVNPDGSYIVYKNGAWCDDMEKSEVWADNHAGQYVDFESSAGGGHSGNKAIEINNSNGGKLWRGAAIFLTGGIQASQFGRITFWAKAANNSGSPVEVEVKCGLDPDNFDAEIFNATGARSVPGDGKWYKISVPFDSGKEALAQSKRVKLIYLGLGDNAGTLYLDEIKFIPKGNEEEEEEKEEEEEFEEGPGLSIDDFEDGEGRLYDAANLANGYWSGGNGESRFTTDDKHTGAQSVATYYGLNWADTAQSGYTGWGYSQLNHDLSEFTKITFWIKTNNSGDSYSFELKEETKTHSYTVSVPDGQANKWVKIEIQFTSFSEQPVNKAALKEFTFLIAEATADGGVVYLDTIRAE
jgi:hypothetical protein